MVAHILFISYHYPPEKGAAATRISETARRLAKSGNQVTVLTSIPNYPTGIVPEEYRGRLVHVEEHEGVRVIFVWCYVSPNRGFARRVLAQLSFAFMIPLLGFRAAGKPDLIIIGSPPLFNAIAGRILAWLKRCPFIFLVADLWPESAIQLGMLRNRIVIRLAEWLEWSTYRQASLVWVVTEGIRKNIIERGLSPEKLFLLKNGVDTKKFKPLAQAEARAELGWGSQFIALYAGTHGLAQGLDTLLDAAELLRSMTDIRIVLVGEGAAKQALMAQAKQRDLTNVEFLESRPHDQMPQLLAASDVCLIPLKKLSLFEGALPSKMFEAMACARPIVLSVAGEARRLAEREAGSAIAVEPENADELASAILHLYEHPEEARTLGQQGRAFVEKHFDRDRLVVTLEARIASLLNYSDSTPALSSEVEAEKLLEPVYGAKQTRGK